MAVFGLESTDIAFLGLIFAVLGATMGPVIKLLIKTNQNQTIFMKWMDKHEEKSSKESDLLDRLVTKMAVMDTRVRAIENRIFKRNGAINMAENDEANGGQN